MITTTNEALVRMVQVTADKLADVAAYGYTDSDYDRLENYLTVTTALLSADYEDQQAYLPGEDEAVWCPDEVRAFLKEAKK